ncbi:IS3 family transposase [Streptomyces sp. 8L]|uniref:IS3 family transposase n=1 Tax=Streptomyces sp. 8L TaxID=2877242 RepID=UPI001CD4EDCC|nr:IS3 family transposase [Streptomyces sp. 8L]MCA1224415.1 IS3 family transposase [Streptomyces sp. 8L]
MSPYLAGVKAAHAAGDRECVLRELSIASSTYYRWRRAEKEPCEHKRRDAELTERIKKIHADSGGIYGSPLVHAALKREEAHVGRKRVERLMREAGIAGVCQAPGFVESGLLNLFHPVLTGEMGWSAAVVTRQGPSSLAW